MLDGIITNWNTGAERLKGYTADEIVAGISRGSTRARSARRVCPARFWSHRGARPREVITAGGFATKARAEPSFDKISRPGSSPASALSRKRLLVVARLIAIPKLLPR